MCLDGDPCDVYHERERVARRHYVCAECDGPIPKGTRYVRVTSLSEGSWDTGYQHVECCEIWHIVQVTLCGNVGLRYVGGLREELREWDEATVCWDDEDNEVWPAGSPLESLLDECAAGYAALRTA